jgi:hemoglobin-like flavoprotein
MLTAQDITLVRASFAQVLPMQETAAGLFYNHLFAIAPGLRRLFPTDLTPQKRKLMEMIATAVGGLDKHDELVPAVRALGARHAAYGITVAHYGVVGQALIWTLERGLGQALRRVGRPAGPAVVRSGLSARSRWARPVARIDQRWRSIRGVTALRRN